MSLLQKLLSDRSEVLVLFGNEIFCSCGALFQDLADAENHLVTHTKVDVNVSTRSVVSDIIRDTLSELTGKILEYFTSTKTGSEKSLKVVQLPDKVCAITLEEGDLDGGQLKEAVCCECAAQLDSFESLRSHFRCRHIELWEPLQNARTKNILRQVPKKKDFLPGWSFRYYCPIPGCKYHLLTSDAKFFGSKDQLRQHYSKVHAHRSFFCDACSASFGLEVYLKRHKASTCGKKFVCPTCRQVYSVIENLQTHCRRKNHQFPSGITKPRKIQRIKKGLDSTPVSFINVAGNLIATLPSKILTSPSTSGNAAKSAQSYPVKIAPKPSPLHLTAAIALSELAGETVGNAGTQNPSGILSTSKPGGLIAVTNPSQENSFRCSAQVQTYLSSYLATVSEQQTQTPLLGARFVSIPPCFTSSNIFTTERIQWTSSTQTSPRVYGVLQDNASILSSTEPKPTKETDQLVDGDLLLLTSTNDNGTFTDSQGSTRRRPPKLGEIEQFSTETQTDVDFDVLQLRLLKSRRECSNSPSSEGGDDPMFSSTKSLMEAETQFDLGDILCSNYTQTNTESDADLRSLMMDSSRPSTPATFNSSMTQTVRTGLGSLESIYRNQSQYCQTILQSDTGTELSHMETQTAVEDLFKQFG